MLKNISNKIFISFLLSFFIFFGFTQTTFAQGIETPGAVWNCVGTDDANKFDCQIPYTIQTGSESVPGIPDTGTVNRTEQKNTQQIQEKRSRDGNASVITNPKPPAKGCSLWPSSFSLVDCITEVINLIFTGIFSTINWFLSQILWLSSFIFDFVVYFTIVKFKTNFANLQAGGIGQVVFGSGGEGLIYYLWGMIRDFLNIIIFILIVYAAVRSMFEGFESTRNKFITLLLFSIVANFSLLFVKLAIDISNILALQAYTLAVQPKSTNSFWEFRDVGGSGVRSYGEYIMNSIDMERLTNEQTGINAAKSQVQSLKSTAFFQIGKMVVLVGVIYVLLFMAGLLITRAVVFLFAMIISPLIALDLFFKMMGNRSGKEGQDLAKGIRKITDKLRGDFYDALVKGPLLIFFVFLIGVLAESILSQGVINNLTTEVGRMSDVRGIKDSSFITSIFTLFKFAIFLALCQVLFKQLLELKFGGESGTRLRKYGGKLANSLLGRGISGASNVIGSVGRNTLGRAASNPNGRIGRGLASLENRAFDLKNSKSKTAQILGRSIGGVTNALQTGTYDPRNAIKPNTGLGKVVGSLGTKINTATSGFAGVKTGINTGTAETKNFEQLKKEKEDRKEAKEKAEKEKAKADILEEVAKASSGIKATAQQKQEAAESTKIKGTEVTLSQLDQVLAEKALSGKLGSGQALSDSDLAKIKTIGINTSDIKMLASAAQKDPEILNKIDTARGEAKGKVDKSVAAEKARVEKEKLQEIVKKQVASNTNSLFKGEERDANNQAIDELQSEKGKNKVNKMKTEAKKFSIILDAKKDLEDAQKQIESTLKYDTELKTVDPALGLSEDQLKNILLQKKEIEDILGSDIIKTATSNRSHDNKFEDVEAFGKNSELQKKIINSKENTSDLLLEIYDTSQTNPNHENVKINFEKIKEIKDESFATLKAFERTVAPDPSTPEFKIYTKKLQEVQNKYNKYNNIYESRSKNLENINGLQRKADLFKEKIEANFGEKKPEAAPETKK